ncbi:hypothetical protein [Endozoicomonas sp.]|uniref:hypothetical protein n=1 Tax=Endozoicomonas sp. TaxID=1892382 RepID=UPI00383BBBE0
MTVSSGFIPKLSYAAVVVVRQQRSEHSGERRDRPSGHSSGLMKKAEILTPVTPFVTPLRGYDHRVNDQKAHLWQPEIRL